MNIDSVSARNLKGHSFTLDLARMNFILGPNFSGKSARSDALRLALLGYLPELGKTNAATFGLSSAEELVVAAHLDGKPALFRRWFVKGDAVKCEEIVPDALERNPVVGVMLNSEAYFGLSHNERAAFVSRNLPHKHERTIDDIREQLKTTLLDDAADFSGPNVHKFLGELAQKEAEREFVSAQAWIESAIEWVEEMEKLAKGSRIVMEKTAQGLSHLRAGDAPTIDLVGLDNARAGLIAELDRLHAERAKKSAAAEAARVGKRKRAELVFEIKAKAGFETTRAKILGRIEALRRERAALPECSPMIESDLRDEYAGVKQGIVDLERQLNEAVLGIGRNEHELAGIKTQHFCPYCGTRREGWREKKETEIEAAISGLQQKEKVVREQLGNVKEHAVNLGVRVDDMRKNNMRRNALEREIATAVDELGPIERELLQIVFKETQLAAMGPLEEEALLAAAEDAQKNLDLKNEELRKLDERRKAAAGRAHDMKRLAGAEENREKAIADEALAKRSVAFLKKVRAELVAEVFAPLLELANGVFSEVLPSPLAYLDGEIGTWRNGAWVGHKTFSGTEKALAYAALQAALAMKSPVRIMILDELGRIGDENLRKVLELISRAIKNGRIDQFVGIDVSRFTTYATLAPAFGAKIINLEALALEPESEAAR